MHGLHEEAELLRELAADAADARQQVAALGAIDQRHQPVTDFEADDVDGTHVLPRQLLLLRRDGGGGGSGGGASSTTRLVAFLLELPRAPARERRERTGT